jgi:hypothetical protein
VRTNKEIVDKGEMLEKFQNQFHKAEYRIVGLELRDDSLLTSTILSKSCPLDSSCWKILC